MDLGAPGIYSATLNVDRAGPWELIVDDGHTAARIPFLVPAQVVPPWKKASDYGFFAAGALLIISLGVALRARRNWITFVPATGMVIALTVAVTGAALSAYSPPPRNPVRTSTPPSRISVIPMSASRRILLTQWTIRGHRRTWRWPLSSRRCG